MPRITAGVMHWHKHGRQRLHTPPRSGHLIRLVLVFGVAITLALGISWPLAAADWPQVACDAGHTGYTSDCPKPPFRLRWIFAIHQPTNTAAQPTVGEGLVFLSSNWGQVLAVDLHTGRLIWRFVADGPAPATPIYHQGRVLVVTTTGSCYALEATSGRVIWQRKFYEGFSASPVAAGNLLVLAGRKGNVYAVEAKDGKLLWQNHAGAMVMATPALAEGVTYVAGGDNRIYAFSLAEGQLLWRSEQLPGMAIRDYWLVAARGSVFATTQLVYGAHATYAMMEKAIMEPFRRAYDGQMLVQDELFGKIRRWYEEHPHQQTFHVLDAATGKRRYIVPIIPVHGGGCTGPLPVVPPSGPAYVVFANVRVQASGWAFPGTLNLEDGSLAPLIRGRYWIDADQWEWQPKPGTRFDRHSPFATGFCVNDQSWGLAVGGHILFTVRDPGWDDQWPVYGYIDLRSGEDGYLLRDVQAGKKIVAAGSYGQAFHATCSPPVVSGKFVVHKTVRNVLVCFEGR